MSFYKHSDLVCFVLHVDSVFYTSHRYRANDRIRKERDESKTSKTLIYKPGMFVCTITRIDQAKSMPTDINEETVISHVGKSEMCFETLSHSFRNVCFLN